MAQSPRHFLIPVWGPQEPAQFFTADTLRHGGPQPRQTNRTCMARFFLWRGAVPPLTPPPPCRELYMESAPSELSATFPPVQCILGLPAGGNLNRLKGSREEEQLAHTSLLGRPSWLHHGHTCLYAVYLGCKVWGTYPNQSTKIGAARREVTVVSCMIYTHY